MKINKKKLLKWLNEKRKNILSDLATETSYINQGRLKSSNEVIEYIESINKYTEFKFKYTEIVKYIGQKLKGHENKLAHVIDRHHIGPSHEKDVKVKFFHNGYVGWFKESELESIEKNK